jgi:hypothetical protein
MKNATEKRLHFSEIRDEKIDCVKLLIGGEKSHL